MLGAWGELYHRSTMNPSLAKSWQIHGVLLDFLSMPLYRSALEEHTLVPFLQMAPCGVGGGMSKGSWGLGREPGTNTSLCGYKGHCGAATTAAKWQWCGCRVVYATPVPSL